MPRPFLGFTDKNLKSLLVPGRYQARGGSTTESALSHARGSRYGKCETSRVDPSNHLQTPEGPQLQFSAPCTTTLTTILPTRGTSGGPIAGAIRGTSTGPRGGTSTRTSVSMPKEKFLNQYNYGIIWI